MLANWDATNLLCIQEESRVPSKHARARQEPLLRHYVCKLSSGRLLGSPRATCKICPPARAREQCWACLRCEHVLFSPLPPGSRPVRARAPRELPVVSGGARSWRIWRPHACRKWEKCCPSGSVTSYKCCPPAPSSNPCASRGNQTNDNAASDAHLNSL